MGTGLICFSPAWWFQPYHLCLTLRLLPVFLGFSISDTKLESSFMPRSAQKGLHRVLLSIRSPLMCSEKGNHLEAAGMGVWDAQPGPLSTALPESAAVYVCSLLYGAPTHARTLLLFICSPQVTPPRHSPAYTLDVTHSLFFGIALFPLMVPVTPCSYSSLHSRSVLPATVLDTGDKQWGKGARITHLASPTLLGIRDKLSPQLDNFALSLTVSLPLIAPASLEVSPMKADLG